MDKYYNLKSKDKFAALTLEERLNIAYELIEGLKADDLYPYRRPLDEANSVLNGTFVGSAGKNNGIINLASNDYLNFTEHPDVIKVSSQTIKEHGVGSGSVPMLGGTLRVHKQLERDIADFMGCESAITYNSCYAANYGLLTAMLTSSDIAILDTYVHASIIDGCCNTNKTYFNHNDPDSLKLTMKKATGFKNKLVIIDGVYSMDGDVAKLTEILEIARDNGAWVMMDESHALGVIGDRGKGTQNYLDIKNKVDIISSSMGKSLGGIGGFIAGSEKLISLLEITSRPFIFSTSIPPNNAASLIKAIELLNKKDPALNRLWDNITYFRDNIKQTGIESGNSETAIFPLIIRDEVKLLNMCKMLHQQGIYVNPIFYPVVQKKKSRIRVSITAGLTQSDLDYTLDKIAYYGKSLGII
ncbi:MAG: aminotransferase class I/II-fold pyridoxal phosphate-dependent enzyme [Crocinitomicaceae bacterium]|nr:aminotransferase class I/II-fold pyridoxal phosphate-dependent enzyme [Crocinitomicaceae bacterium]